MTAKTTKLTSGRVRCQYCKKSMKKLVGNASRSPITGRIVQVHYRCLADHVSRRDSSMR